LGAVHHIFEVDQLNETPLRTGKSSLRISFNLRKIAHKVHFVGLDSWFPDVEFGATIYDRKKYQGQVISHESISLPFSLQEDGPSTKLYLE
jgi:hypothetical protein